VRLAGLCADSDEEMVGGECSLTGRRISADGMRIHKFRPASYQFNVVAHQRVMDDPDLALDDTADMANQLLHGGARPGLVGERFGNFKTGSGVDAADRFSEGFGRDGAGFDAETTANCFFSMTATFFPSFAA